MFAGTRVLLAALAASALLTACSNDITKPDTSASTAHFAKATSGIDSSLVSGGGGGGGGGGSGGGGGGSSSGSCGVLSANISTYNIVVYTTRIGIGFSGTAYNCGTRNQAFEVVVSDVETDAVCHVDVPHFIAAKNTAPGGTVGWSANSTLVNCQNRTHTFVLTLVDTKTGQTVDTKTVSAFL